MKKLDRKLAILEQRYKRKCYFVTNDGLEMFLRVNSFHLDKNKNPFMVCFAITKTIQQGYLLQNLYIKENELKELKEIPSTEFNTALEHMKVFVDLGTIYD